MKRGSAAWNWGCHSHNIQLKPSKTPSNLPAFLPQAWKEKLDRAKLLCLVPAPRGCSPAQASAGQQEQGLRGYEEVSHHHSVTAGVGEGRALLPAALAGGTCRQDFMQSGLATGARLMGITYAQKA